jgi:hypothetical protein
MKPCSKEFSKIHRQKMGTGQKLPGQKKMSNLSKNNSPDIERKNNLPINLLMSTIVNLVN